VSGALAGALAAAIAEGGVEVGEMMPPERELAARHRVGRVTVRTALGKLVGEGILECCPGLGYRVVRTSPISRYSSPIGLVYRDLSDLGRAASKSVGAIEALLAKRDRALLIGSSGLTGEGEDACIRRFRSAGAGGLIVAPAQVGTRSAELEDWIRSGRLVVLEASPTAATRLTWTTATGSVRPWSTSVVSVIGGSHSFQVHRRQVRNAARPSWSSSPSVGWNGAPSGP
jgi:hypothetical protein